MSERNSSLRSGESGIRCFQSSSLEDDFSVYDKNFHMNIYNKCVHNTHPVVFLIEKKIYFQVVY